MSGRMQSSVENAENDLQSEMIAIKQIGRSFVRSLRMKHNETIIN
jgi:hypothetical protein